MGWGGGRKEKFSEVIRSCLLFGQEVPYAALQYLVSQLVLE
jgi:hypothetical protein